MATAERTVTVDKSGRDMRLGVRLSGAKGKTVKIVEINPEGPLAGLVEKNEFLMAINGVACSEGHQKAAEDLRTAFPRLELTIASKRASLSQRLTGKRPSSAQLTKQYSSFTEVDTGAVSTSLTLSSEPAMAPVMAAPVPAPAAPAVAKEAVAAVTAGVALAKVAEKAVAPAPAVLKPATGRAVKAWLSLDGKFEGRCNHCHALHFTCEQVRARLHRLGGRI